MRDLLIRGGSVVTADGVRTADVLVRAGKIHEIGDRISRPRAQVVDADGALLLPGVIDAHVHPIHGETVATVSEAAASGGVTTVLHHVYPDPSESMKEWLLAARKDGSRSSYVDFGFHARLRRDAPHHLDEIPAVAALGIRTFKVFTSYRLPGVRFAPGELLPVLTRVASSGGMLLVHAEDQDAIEQGERGATGAEDDVQAYLRARPASTEAGAVRAVAAIALSAAVPVYFVHISSRAALEAIGGARIAGARMIAETCPHYLWLDAQDVAERLGARAKIAPPLRSAQDRDALWAALLDGGVDLVASDHCGYQAPEKEPGTIPFRDAGFGAPGVETLLLLLLDAARTGRLPLPRLVDLLATSPARIFGLEAKGRLEPGYDADIVIVDPGGRTTIGPPYHGAAYYSLYEGRDIGVAIADVFLRGEAVSRDVGDGRPRGRFVATRPEPGA